MKKIILARSLLLALVITFFPFSRVLAGTIEAEAVKVLDYAQLENVADMETQDKTDITGLPKEILDMQGKKVKVTGYFSLPPEEFYDPKPVDKFVVLRWAYGCPCCNWANNPPPTVFNTIFVYLKQGKTLDPPFTSQVDVTGTFIASREYYTDVNGVKIIGKLFYIKDAEANKVDPGWLGILGSIFVF